MSALMLGREHRHLRRASRCTASAAFRVNRAFSYERRATCRGRRDDRRAAGRQRCHLCMPAILMTRSPPTHRRAETRERAGRDAGDGRSKERWRRRRLVSYQIRSTARKTTAHTSLNSGQKAVAGDLNSENHTAVIRRFQERMPYGLIVPPPRRNRSPYPKNEPRRSGTHRPHPWCRGASLGQLNPMLATKPAQTQKQREDNQYQQRVGQYT